MQNQDVHKIVKSIGRTQEIEGFERQDWVEQLLTKQIKGELTGLQVRNEILARHGLR